MESEQELEQVLRELKFYGFEGEDLKKQLQHQLVGEIQQVDLEYQQEFGLNRLLCVLTLVRDLAEDEGRYRLKHIFGTLRRPVEIPAMEIDGVDTLGLDKKMSAINWYEWYWKGKEIWTDDRIVPIMSELSLLFKSRQKEGLETQQRLLFKHWPTELYEQYKIPGGPDLSAACDQSNVFHIEDVRPFFSPSIAYLELSGGFYNLRKAVGLIMKGYMKQERLQTVLRQLLKRFPEAFQITGTVNNPDMFLQCSIPVARQGKGDDYFCGPYFLEMTTYPGLQHAVINGVDSRELERKMLDIDWDKDEDLYVLDSQGAPLFKPAVEEVLSGLSLLDQDPAGSNLAGLLRLKFHQQATFLEHHIPDSAWELWEQLPKNSATFPADMALKKAIKLLEGKAVQYPLHEGVMLGGHEWVRFSPPIEAGKSFSLEPLSGPNYLDIENMLLMLGVLSASPKGYIEKLLDGDKITVETEQGKHLQVQVDASNNSLSVWTMDDKAIPFNFHLDPDFTTVRLMENPVEQRPGAEAPKAASARNQLRKGPAL